MEGKNTSKVFSRKNFEVTDSNYFSYAPVPFFDDLKHRTECNDLMLIDPQSNVPNEMLLSSCSTNADFFAEVKDVSQVVNYSTEDDEENIANFSSNTGKAKIFDF